MGEMSDKVKGRRRRYDSTRRRQRAQETQQGILRAARALFLQRGYAGTTIDAIASDAGVAVETVYAAFRNKRTILSRLVDEAVVGDDRPVPLLEREGPQAVREERDQRRQIAMFVRGIREILERVGPLFDVLQAAAATEPEIAALRENILGQRLVGMRFFVDALRENGPLRLDREETVDTVWTITSPDVHRLLTVERGWPGERYERWLAETLERVLLEG